MDLWLSVTHNRGVNRLTLPPLPTLVTAPVVLDFMQLPLGTYVLDLWLIVLCMRPQAWLAAPVLLAHAEVTKKHNIFFQWVQNLGTPWYNNLDDLVGCWPLQL